MPKKRNTSISRKIKKKVKKSTDWTFDSVFEVNSNVFSRSDGPDRLIVMNVESTEDFFEITGTASKVFKAIDGKRTVNAIIKKLNPSGKDESRFKANVKKLFRNLLAEELVQLAE